MPKSATPQLDEKSPRHLGSLAVCCTKRKVQHINQACMQRLKDLGMFCQAQKSGYFPQDELPTDELLHIKRGERVMILSNKPNNDGSFQHVNGDIGTVLDYGEYNGKPQVTAQLDNDCTVAVERMLWRHYEYVWKTTELGAIQINQHENGTFLQLPLAPAYAITVHKAQG
jgi:ATP-dependent exoDNAse (exonuclease V) alpha subunit